MAAMFRRNRKRTKPFFLYLSNDEKRALRALARADRSSASDIIRSLIVRRASRKGLLPVTQAAPAAR